VAKSRRTNLDEFVAAAARDGRITSSVGVNLDALLGPPEPQTEKEFQAEVMAFGRRAGWRCYHTHDSRKSAAGFPDLVAVRAGRLVVAELKVPGNRPTADQETWLEEFRAVPAAQVFVWYPADWPEIVKILT
jgi:hypothetical protein